MDTFFSILNSLDVVYLGYSARFANPLKNIDRDGLDGIHHSPREVGEQEARQTYGICTLVYYFTHLGYSRT